MEKSDNSKVDDDGTSNDEVQQEEETSNTQEQSNGAGNGLTCSTLENMAEEKALRKTTTAMENMLWEKGGQTSKEVDVSGTNNEQEFLDDDEKFSSVIFSSLRSTASHRRASEGLLQQPNNSLRSSKRLEEEQQEPGGGLHKNEKQRVDEQHVNGNVNLSLAQNMSESRNEGGVESVQQPNEEQEARPGAYPVQGRAFGQVPAWIRRQRQQQQQRQQTSERQQRSFLSRSIRALSQGHLPGEEAVVEAAAVTDATPIVYPDRITTQEELRQEEQALQKKRLRRNWWILSIAVVFVGLAAGLMGYYLPNRNSDDSSSLDVCQDLPVNAPFVLQCRCFGEIVDVSAAAVANYEKLLQMLPAGYVTEDASSCQPGNVALWWLADDSDRRNVSTTTMEETTNPMQMGGLLQRYILGLLYISTDGSSWINQDNWLDPLEECQWGGVECSQQTQILELTLSGMNMQGTIPSELGLLTDLRVLNLNDNNLTGTIPEQLLEQLENLRRIDLSNNQLNGTIPEVVDIDKLIQETLETNPNVTLEQIEEDPSLLMDVNRKLLHMDFSDNALTGSIPLSFGLLFNLRVFRMRNNRLKGRIGPGELNLGFFSEIEEFDTANNSLSGAMPSQIGLLDDLEIINVANNNMNGIVPSEIGLLEELTFLSLRGNQIDGEVPTEILQLEQLVLVDLRKTSLTGALPAGLCDTLLFLEAFRVDCNSSLALNCSCCDCSDLI